MAEYFVDPENGDDSNDGLSAAFPWRLIPGQSGANAVTNGDTINVKNGTTTTGRVLLTHSTLTYRGYGVAANVLELELPVPSAPHRLRTVRVARQWGTHEGMWTIDARANDAVGAAISTSTRANCVVEDVNILGPQVGTRDAVAAASSADNVSGFTMRRFAIDGATQRGVAAYTKSVTLEYGRVHYTVDDNVGLMCSSNNGFRAGSTSNLRYLDLKDPNRANATAAVTGVLGDCIQTVMSVSSIKMYDALTISDVLMTKNTTGKQAMTLADADGGITVERFHIRGTGPGQIVHAQLTGTLRIRNGHVASTFGTSDNMFIRYEGITTPSVAYAMETGSNLLVSNITFDTDRFPGLYHCTETAAAWEMRGNIDFRNTTVMPVVNDSAFSFGATFAFWSSTSTVTFAAGFQFTADNCCIQATGKPHVILPTGTGGDARWKFNNNNFSVATYNIGATTYADLAAFVAAHSYMVATSEAAPLIDATSYQPRTGSPLISYGKHDQYRKDAGGQTFWNPPACGAHEYRRARTARI